MALFGLFFASLGYFLFCLSLCFGFDVVLFGWFSGSFDLNLVWFSLFGFGFNVFVLLVFILWFLFFCVVLV